MNILKAIGGLFVKLWRWIKETAWVQPLLIVGAIFAVIFSIPKITEWVQSMDAGSVSAYYTQFKLTLEGQTSTDEHTTQADEITGFINDWSNFDHKYTSYADYKAGLDKDAKDMIEKYGEKFYLVYVGKDCTNCETIQPGFEALQENWGSSYVADDSRSFKMYTIFSDEESTNDDDFDTDDNKKAFVRYLDKWNDEGFFTNGGGRLEEAPYHKAASVSDSDYEHFIDADHSSFSVPTILLVDFSEEAFNLQQSRVGLSEVMFGVSGSDKVAKADLLMEMWNHTTKTDNTNPFSDVYKQSVKEK